MAKFLGATLTALFAEMLGTALLVFLGVGSVVTATGGGTYIHHKGKGDEKYYMILGSGNSGQPLPTSTLHVAFGFGMTVACIAQTLGAFSGSHLNPAVSFGLVFAGRFDFGNAVAYSIFQTLGATGGALALKLLTLNIVEMADGGSFSPGSSYNPATDFKGWHLGTSLLGPGMTFVTGILMEAALTFFLVLVVLGSTDPARNNPPVAVPFIIGFAVFICHIVGISYTGSSVNPARSIGPVFFSPEEYAYLDLPVYIIGPMIGGAVAGIVYPLFN